MVRPHELPRYGRRPSSEDSIPSVLASGPLIVIQRISTQCTIDVGPLLVKALEKYILTLLREILVAEVQPYEIQGDVDAAEYEEESRE